MLLICAVAFVSCTKVVYDDPTQAPDEPAFINLSAKPEYIIDIDVKGSGDIANNNGFGSDKLAVYAVKYSVANPTPPYNFSNANRVISTKEATISADGVLTYGANKAEFPGSRVAVYSIFPSEEKNGVKIIDNGASSSDVIGAEVVLKSRYDQQYDVLLAKNENLDRTKHIKGQAGETLDYKHVLSQLRVKMYADADVGGAKKVTKVEVQASGSAKLTDITTPNFSDFGADATFVLYDDATGITIDVTTKDGAKEIENVLMLFPGVISSVIFTIDGSQYTVAVPNDKLIVQGAYNTIVLKLTKLGVKFDRITIDKWVKGASQNENTDIIKRKTELSVQLKKANQNYVSGSTPQYKAEVQINGSYWMVHKPSGSAPTMMIPCTFDAATSKLKFSQKIETLMLNGDAIYLSALRIYEDGIKIFDGFLSPYSPNGGKLLINQTTGEVTFGVGGSVMTADVGIGNFGMGTQEFPYEIDDAVRFSNIRDMFATTPSTPLYFIQTKDIDLAPHLLIDGQFARRSVESGIQVLGDDKGWSPIGASVSTCAYMHYDGKGHKIAGVYIYDADSDNRSLLGIVGRQDGVANSIKNLVVEGRIKGGNYSAGLVSQVSGGGNFERCINRVDVEGIPKSTTTTITVGGLIGKANYSGITMIDCGNEGDIAISSTSSSSSSVAGVIGGWMNGSTLKGCYNRGEISTHTGRMAGLVGGNFTGTATIEDCYNKGGLTGSGANLTAVGGVFATWSHATAVLVNCYNSGVITATATNLGALVGQVNVGAKGVNCFYNNSGINGFGSNVAAVGITNSLPTSTQMNSGRVGENTVWIDVAGEGPKLKWEF